MEPEPLNLKAGRRLFCQAEGATAGERQVTFALLLAHRLGLERPTAAELAALSGLEERSVRRLLARLEGVTVTAWRDGRRGSPDRYAFTGFRTQPSTTESGIDGFRTQPSTTESGIDGFRTQPSTTESGNGNGRAPLGHPANANGSPNTPPVTPSVPGSKYKNPNYTNNMVSTNPPRERTRTHEDVPGSASSSASASPEVVVGVVGNNKSVGQGLTRPLNDAEQEFADQCQARLRREPKAWEWTALRELTGPAGEAPGLSVLPGQIARAFEESFATATRPVVSANYIIPCLAAILAEAAEARQRDFGAKRGPTPPVKAIRIQSEADRLAEREAALRRRQAVEAEARAKLAARGIEEPHA